VGAKCCSVIRENLVLIVLINPFALLPLLKTINMKNILLLLVFIFTTVVYSQVYSGPESVEWDAANNRWLISNTTSHSILARSVGGTLTTLVPTTLSGPHGIEILNNVLYADCGGIIKGFDLTTGTQVFTLDLSASFLNGLTTDGDSVLYATDFTNKDIFRINPSTNKYYLMSSNTVTTPNGIIYDGANNRCVFVAWGTGAPIKAISLTPPYTITTLTTTTLSNCDGITRDANGYYYVSTWGNNRLNRFRPDFTNGFTILNAFVLNSPADLGIKPGSTDTVGVPNSGNNTCTFVPLNQAIPEFTTSATTICEGDTVIFTDASLNTTSISWGFPGASPASGNTSPISVTFATPGAYTTTLTSTNAFGSATSTTTINVIATPVPLITAVGNDLTTTSTFSTYQWYHNGVLIPGATSQVYTITAGGDYYCEVTTSGCVGVSNTLSSTVGTEIYSVLSTKVYPNPASNYMIIEFNTNQDMLVQYTMLDIQGKTIKASNRLNAVVGTNLWNADISDLSPGSYILQLSTEHGRINRSFIVMR
jgi:hypothetical protein